MTLKKFLILMSFGALFCWGSWLFVMNTTNPYETGFLGLFLFYSSLFLALCGSLVVVGLFVRMKIFKDYTIFKHLNTAFRQAVFFSILLVGGLLLQSKGLLTWWNITIFILGITLLEFFFISYKGD